MSVYSVGGFMVGIGIQWFGLLVVFFLSLIFSIIYLILYFTLDLFTFLDIFSYLSKIVFHDITEKILRFGGMTIGALIALYRTIKDPDRKIYD